MKFYKMPYDDWSCLSHNKFDFIVRFENLQKDFTTALNLIGIEPKRSIPIVNKTVHKKKDFISYYATDEVIERAKKVFGPYMKKWAYELPSAWGVNHISRLTELELYLLNKIRRLIWRYF